LEKLLVSVYLAIRRYAQVFFALLEDILRAPQTGRSKHYAFIEFESSRVAEIVAETMDNYLLMGHIMKCSVVPKAEVHPELWIGANKKFKVLPRARLERDCHNKVRTFQLSVEKKPMFLCSSYEPNKNK
jgi:nucleolar protein 15